MPLARAFCVAVLCASSFALYGQTASPALKPPMAGVMAMGNIYFHRQDGGIPDNSLKLIEARPGLIDGVAINITWAQLQPKPDTLDTTALDAALASVRRYNKLYPKTPLQVLVRIWPGPVAPKWVKNLGGPAVTILHRDDPITVGRFWTRPYQDAWRSMMTQLGHKYDSDPLINSMANCGSSSITDEPLLLPGDELSIGNLKAAGFTDAAYVAVLMDSYHDFDAWPTTNVEETFSPYRQLDSGRPSLHTEVTVQLMRHWRETMGQRGVVSNHAISGPPEERLVFMYDEAKKLGQPIEFQTQAPRELKFDDTVTYSAAHGAAALELWQTAGNYPGFETYPADMLRKWSAELKANATRQTRRD